MDNLKDIQAWLDENHPDLVIREMNTKGGGGYIVEQKVFRTETVYDGDEPWFEYQAEGKQEVFRIKNRLLGSWIADEVRRRDPRFAHIPGNNYHAAWKASLEAETEHHADRKAYQQSALESWEIAKRNPALMDRFARRLSAGDKYAWREFSLENIARHATKNHASEMRSKDFWRSLEREMN